MRFFLDCEFWESKGRPLELISLGIVSDAGTELYVADADFDWGRQELREDDSGKWLLENVWPNLDRGPCIAVWRRDLGKFVKDFVVRESCGEGVDFWGWWCAHDWVAFCQIWGRLVDLPEEFPDRCSDVGQLWSEVGGPKLPEPPKSHCAIEDARWIREAFYSLLRRAEEAVMAPEARDERAAGRR
jgi:hypothetical protein